MKIVFVVYTEVYTPRVMALLDSIGIDYYTRWEEVKGKGHGTEAHLGTRSFPGVNSMMMIAFQEEGPLEKLVQAINSMNAGITRADDKMRLFQLPLERIV
jgi:hypothetical protein